MSNDPRTRRISDTTRDLLARGRAQAPLPAPTPAAPAPQTAPVVVIPNLAGYLLRIADGSRKPPTAYLTAAQLRDLHDAIARLLDGPTRLTDATPPGAHCLSAYALGF